MADVIRDVLIRAKMELIKTELPAPDLAPFFKEAKQNSELAREQIKLVREAEEKYKASADAFAKAEAQKQDAVDETNRRVKENNDAQEASIDASLRSAEGLRTAADGAFAFARGLALTGLEGSDSLDVVVRRIADVQAKFDLFRGSIDVLKGTTESVRSLNETLASTGGIAGAARTGLAQIATAAGPVLSALGPAGAIAVAAGGTAAAIGLVWQKFATDAEEASQRAIKAAEEAARESGRIARDRQRQELGVNLGAAVATARDQLSLAQSTGSQAEKAAARQRLAEVTESAIQRRRNQLRTERADPRLTIAEQDRLGETDSQLQVELAEAQRQALLDEARARGPQFQQQRDRASSLIGERARLREELEGVEATAFDLGNLGTAVGSQALDRRNQIVARLEEIAELRPDENLNAAVEGLANLQETTNDALAKLNSSVAFWTNQAERYRQQAEKAEAMALEAANN